MPELKMIQALVLSTKQLGERAWIVSLFTPQFGRLVGVLRKKQAPQIGTLVAARHQARLVEQMGTLYLEEICPLAVRFMDDEQRLACLTSLCALLDLFLPERQAFPTLYRRTLSFLETLAQKDFLKDYVLFERDLLAEIGFGLDTTACAGGGDATDLAYISPKTGRAVSREKGLPYHTKLLILPRFLWQPVAASSEDIQAGLHLTGYFLHMHAPKNKLPVTRKILSRR